MGKTGTTVVYAAVAATDEQSLGTQIQGFAHQLADPVTGGPKRISLAHRHVPQTCSRRDLNRHSSNMGSAEQTEMRLQRLAHRTSYLHRMQTTTSQLRERLSKTFAAICHGRP